MTDINIQSLFPALRNSQIARPTNDVFNTTFIGIDFGTSTTVVSIATIDKETKEILTTPIWLNQRLYDDPKELEQFRRRKFQYMAKDIHDRDVFLAESGYILQMAQEEFKNIKFHFSSEF